MPKTQLMQKHLLSFFALLLFAALALGSKVNNIHHNAFVYDKSNEDTLEKGNYLIKNDGTKVHGNNIGWKTGLLVKNTVGVDDQEFAMSEIKGFRKGNSYHIRHKNYFLQRIVHGKVNVYVLFTKSFEKNTKGENVPYTRTDHWVQRGDDGPLVILASQKDMRKFLADCPLSVEMASLSNGKIRKRLKVEPNYLNSIFDVYNNGCKPLKKIKNANKK